MRKGTFCFIILFCCTQQLFGQLLTYQWTATVHYDLSAGVVAAAPDNHGNFFLLGNYVESVCFSSIANIAKIDPYGSITWAQEYVNDSGCLDEYLYSVYFFDSSLVVSGAAAEGVIARLDTGGAEIWQRDSLNSYILCAVDAIGSATVIDAPTHIVQRYDASGNFIWEIAIQHSFAITPVSLKGISLGNTYVYYSYNNPLETEPSGVGVSIISPSGSLLIDTTINGMNSSDPDYAVDLEINENGDAFMLSKDNSGNVVCINKYDFISGTISQVNYFSPSGCSPRSIEIDTLHDYIYASVRCSSGYRILKYDYYLNPLDTIITNNGIIGLNVLRVNSLGYVFHTYRPFGSDSLVIEIYDWDGALIGLYFQQNTSLNLVPIDLIFDSSGGLYVVCDGNDMSGNYFGVVVKFDQTTNVDDPTSIRPTFTMAPNPSSVEIVISYLSYGSYHTLTLMNSLGEKVKSDYFYGSTYSMSTQEYSSGVYFVDLVSDSGERSTQKLIIQH